MAANRGQFVPIVGDHGHQGPEVQDDIKVHRRLIPAQ